MDLIKEQKYTDEFILEKQCDEIKEIKECIKFFEDIELFNTDKVGFNTEDLELHLKFQNSMIKETQERFKMEKENKELADRMLQLKNEKIQLEQNQKDLIDNLAN